VKSTPRAPDGSGNMVFKPDPIPETLSGET